MGIHELLEWAVGRMPMWDGRVMRVPPEEAEALVMRAYRIYIEQLVCEPYPRHTPIRVRITAARGDAMGFLVNQYFECLAHEKITADYRAVVRRLRRRDERCTGYEAVLGAIYFLYQQEHGWAPLSLAVTCQELDIPIVDEEHRRHVRAVAALVNRWWVRNHQLPR